MKQSKRFKAALGKVDQKKLFSIEEAIARVKETATAKFTEGVDIAVRLGVDPKKADQAIRGTVALPHGIGKEVRVLVIARPPKDEEAKAAGFRTPLRQTPDPQPERSKCPTRRRLRPRLR